MPTDQDRVREIMQYTILEGDDLDFIKHRLVAERARATEAEFWRGHPACDSNTEICQSYLDFDPCHNWTPEQWLAAAGRDVGVE